MKTCLALALAALLPASPVAAQNPAMGGDLFFTYCASCHGEDATGAGPMTSILTIAPPDLTGLAAQNGGVFPRARVAYRIDGRDPLPAHGGDMPFFGDLFEGETAAMKTDSGQPILTGRGIVDLVAWLESIQN